MNVEQMRSHVASLCEANEIIISAAPGGRAYSSYWLREVFIPPVRSTRTYATALHEIGHVLGRHQLSEVVLVRERWAWVTLSVGRPPCNGTRSGAWSTTSGHRMRVRLRNSSSKARRLEAER